MAKSKAKKMNYREAVAELERIVEKVESPDVSIMEIGDELKRAAELVKYCREELKGYEKEFSDIVYSKGVNL